MNHLFILAHGDTFDLDAYLAVNTLAIKRMWRVGDLPTPTAGVIISLGDDRSDHSSDAEQIAIEYLRNHKAELRALGQFPGIEVFNLGMEEVVDDVCESLGGFTLGMSTELMSLALEIGTRPVFYVELRHLRAGTKPRL